MTDWLVRPLSDEQLLYAAADVDHLLAIHDWLLERLGLGDRLRHHTNQLSGGQQQRVAIARALVTRPAMLLADEPTGNLDTKTSLEIMALFQRLNSDEGITVVVVTHEPDIAAFGRRHVAFRDGLIVQDGPTANAA